MKLYILRPIKDLPDNNNPWIGMWDMSHGFVVRAESEVAARRFAADDSADEGMEAWLNSGLSECVELTTDGESGVIMEDFCRG